MDAGPRRATWLGELKQAVEKTPVSNSRFYYSLYEWFNPLWKDKTKCERFVDEHFLPQIKQLVTRDRPAIFSGPTVIGKRPRCVLEDARSFWPGSITSPPWLHAPCGGNDRWGKECRLKAWRVIPPRSTTPGLEFRQ